MYLRAKNEIAMKTILTIILAIGIQVSTLFADNIGETITPMSPKNIFCPECPILIPKVPLEAPFAEMTQFNIPISLTPTVPLEATFDDELEIAAILDSSTPTVDKAISCR